MYENTENFVDIDFEQQVRQTAYHLWEDQGRPFGRETEYWFKALEQLLARRSAARLEPGSQQDDNIDDLGRKADGSTVDQPTGARTSP